MKTSYSMRVLAIVLSVIMVIGMAPITVFAIEGATALSKGDAIDGTDFYVTSIKNYAIAPDIIEKLVTTNNSERTSQTQAYVMEVNTLDGNAKIVAGYGNLNPTEKGWTMATTTAQAHLYEKAYSENVVGGVNASWFNIDTGEPSGTFVMRGTIHKDVLSNTFVAAFDDGSVNIFEAGTTVAQATAMQSAQQGKDVTLVEAIDAFGAPIVWNGEYTGQPTNVGQYPRSAVGIKEDGTVVILQSDGCFAPRSCGYTTEEEAALLISLGCVKALALDEGGSSTYVSQREGESDLTMRSTPAGGDERVISGSILVVSTVPASDAFDHASVTPNGGVYTPDSVVNIAATGITRNGSLSSALPEDLTFVLADETMGTVGETTVNGNDATAIFTAAEKTGDAVINAVSEGKIVGTVTLSIQNPDAVTFTSADVSLDYNEVSDLGLVALYKGEQVTLNDKNVIWSITDETAGSFSGLNFTATSNVKYSGSPVVTATIGEISAQVTVNIGMAPMMALDGGDEDGLDYSMIGQATTNAGTIPAGYVGTCYYGRGAVVSGEVVNDTQEEWADIVRFGHNAVKINYDFTQITGTDGAEIGLGGSKIVDGSPTAVGMWVYIPDADTPLPWLRLQISTSTNGGANWTNAYVDFFSQYADQNTHIKTGWNYFEADLTNYKGATIRINSGKLIRCMCTTAGIGWYTINDIQSGKTAYKGAGNNNVGKDALKGYLIVDNVVYVYGKNNQDITSPVLKTLSVINTDGSKTEIENGTTIKTNNINFFAAYDDSETTDPFAEGIESAYYYIDGAYVGTGDVDVLGSTLRNVYLSDGEHSVTFYLKDGYGNVTRDTRYFTVEGEEDITSVTLVSANAPEVGNTWKLNLISSDTRDLTGALEANVAFTKNTDVTGVTFASGVTGTYTYDKASGKLVISISNVNITKKNIKTIATVDVAIPESVIDGTTISYQVTKGSYNTVTDTADKTAFSFSTNNNTLAIGATYEIAAEVITKGMTAEATVTVIAEDGKPAANVDVYANGEKVATTDENGIADISSLNTEVASYKLYAKDADNNYSYEITVYCYAPTGAEKPEKVLFNMVENAATQKNISWTVNPANSAQKAVVKVSENEDMSDAVEFEGDSTVIAYSKSETVSLVNNVNVDGLSAETTYYYVVGDGENWSDVATFTTAAAEDETTKFFVLADIQEDDAKSGMATIAASMKDADYDFGVQLGDAVDNVRYLNQWTEAIDLFTADAIKDVNMLHVIGNHEADDDGNNAIAAKKTFGIDDDWYSLENGEVYIAVLNHTLDKAKLEEFGEWLVEDAANTECTWKVLLTHVPVYYTNPTGGGEIYNEYLVKYIDEAGMDFFFAGNDHALARTAPMAGGEKDENGTVYYVAGSTGGKSYALVDTKEFNFELATLEFSHVYIDVEADKYQITVKAVDVTGTAEEAETNVLDTYSKHVPICADDEHEYVYIAESNTLYCAVCDSSLDCETEKTTGWYKDSVTGEDVYLNNGEVVDYLCDYDNAEHKYLYNRETDELTCGNDNCTYCEKAYDEAYNGWATDVNGEGDYYFVGGKYVTGYIYDTGDIARYFADNGIAFSGEKTICGEKVTFADGAFVATEDILLAGYVGDKITNVEFVLYADGRLVLEGEGNPAAFDSYNAAYPTVPWNANDYRGSVKTISVAKEITSISKGLFRYCSNATEIIFEEGSACTKIGVQAFFGCHNLKSVTLPDGCAKIFGQAFGVCNELTDIYVPASVKYIDDNAFTPDSDRKNNTNLIHKVVMKVECGSYAHKYAVRLGIDFTANHKYNDGVITTPATATSEGVMTYTCSVCKDSYTEAIAKLDATVMDVNGDGNIDIADARLALRIAIGLETEANTDIVIAAADINGDGQVTVDEARAILRKAVGFTD